MYGGSIATYGISPFTTQPGTKVLAYKEIARDLWTAEIKEGNLIEDENGQFINAYNSKRYAPATYPFTTSWGVTVNDDSEYHEAFNEQAREVGGAKINAIFQSFGRGLWKADLTFDYIVVSPGDVFTLHFPEIHPDLDGRKLRVDDITYVLGQQNYVTVSLKEDEKTIS